MKKAVVAISFPALYLPAICLAHPVHGKSGGYTITHYFTESVRVITSLVILTGASIYNRYLIKDKQQKENS